MTTIRYLSTADVEALLDPQAVLAALADGSFSREDFVETQVQFLFAVVFFSRPMAVLAGRLPRPEQRLSLLENVHDGVTSPSRDS